ncbi:hypothetical protein [Pseudomonas nicosulfuronedens]
MPGFTEPLLPIVLAGRAPTLLSQEHAGAHHPAMPCFAAEPVVLVGALVVASEAFSAKLLGEVLQALQTVAKGRTWRHTLAHAMRAATVKRRITVASRPFMAGLAATVKVIQAQISVPGLGQIQAKRTILLGNFLQGLYPLCRMAEPTPRKLCQSAYPASQNVPLGALETVKRTAVHPGLVQASELQTRQLSCNDRWKLEHK